MKLFLDTANIKEIKDAYSLGVVDGVTTNPTIISREGRDFIEVIKEILSTVEAPVNAEVISLDAEGMIKEGRELSKLHKNIVVKIPMCLEGLKAVSVLSKEGVSTNVTLVFSATQALMAANAGADYVSSFLGRVDDIGGDGLALIKDIVDIFKTHNIKSKVIAASVRHLNHVIGCAKIGVDIATVPYKVVMQMAKHPLTDAGLEQFLKDWESVPKK